MSDHTDEAVIALRAIADELEQNSAEFVNLEIDERIPPKQTRETHLSLEIEGLSLAGVDVMGVE